MASKQKIYSHEKLNGKIYTPEFIVQKILDDVAYNSEQILKKTIVDPACGDGRFLIEIVKRIIQFSKQENLEENLQYVYGYDIDPDAVEHAKFQLNQLIKPYEFKMKWNIFVQNTLKQNPSIPFDFVVGNPPYIRIQHLDKSDREFIQKHYKFCKKGSTDIYIAFFEAALKFMNQHGICGYITPNTFFNTETGKELRSYFEQNQSIKQITNYGALQLFENATTYSAVTIFTKTQQNSFLYQEAKSINRFHSRIIKFSEIINTQFWQLSSEKKIIKTGIRLGDICDIHVGITTLADKAYIFENYEEHKEYIIADTHFSGKRKIEKSLLKPIIKASVLKHADEPISRYLLFPYKKTDTGVKIIPEAEFKKNYPFAYSYLISVKPVLDKRDNGKPNKTAWYAYGRSQGLQTSFGKKILFSPMNKTPNFIPVNHNGATFYSGYCIKYKGDYEKLLSRLNSKRMEEYIRISGRDFRGGWKAYNKKIVQEFRIDGEL